MHAKWVKQTTTTSGTGTVTLSAVSGFPTCNDVLVTGEVVAYEILDSDGKPLEAGIGKYLGSNQLERTIPTATYSGGTYTSPASAAVSLSGTNTVILSPHEASLRPALRNAYPSGTQNDNIIFCGSVFACAVAAFNAGAVNRLYYMYQPITTAAKLDGISIRTGATANVDIGIYEMLPDGSPGALLLGWENQNITSGAQVVLTFAAATVGALPKAAQRIRPGDYYIGINTSVATNFGGMGVRYFEDAGGLSGHNPGTLSRCPYEARTQGTLPTTAAATAVATYNGGASSYTHLIGFRRAA